MVSSGREGALKALAAYRKSGAWSDIFLRNLIEKEGLEKREAALATAICNGVLQNRLLLDFYLSCYCAVKLSKLEPLVLDILRLSAYQMLFLEKIPHSAAVNEGVKLTKKYANSRAAGLVNAVLRQISVHAGNLPEIPQEDEATYLSIQYSHPLELVRAFQSRLSPAECEALLAANNEKTPITAQVNTLQTNTPALLQSLESAGVKATAHPWLENSIEIYSSGSIEQLSAFQNGDFFVQDAAASLAVKAAGAKPGMRVLDACSAPGGKAFAAALAMENRGEILACDIHDKKRRQIEKGAGRLGIQILSTQTADARVPLEVLFNWADLVIADVPCSGMGIIRKKPEIRYKDLKELSALPEIQLAILRNLANYVRPGGVLLYSTCTIFKQENEDVVKAFLKLDERYQLEAFTLPAPAGEIKNGMVTLYPHVHKTDGFFISKLRRRR